jgi:mono/diheme cytochrome c family protein
VKRLWSGVAVMAGACVLMGAADGSWLKRVPAADRAKVSPLTDQRAAAEAGAHLYANECARCHGASGEGKGSRPALVSVRVAGATDGELAWLLKNGNPWKGMPAWGSLPDAQRWQLVAYVKALNAGQGSGTAEKQQGETK